MDARSEHELCLVVEDLPELDTPVGISGSTRQQEVGGAVCIGIIAGIALYNTV
ncbi:hypothetical protein [Allosphingosinicella sp.]|uniref:hypothetical protein n=1 Tax=Allosphingosinicella sp. TaxID=2823234 RepID=UPI002FC0BFC0